MKAVLGVTGGVSAYKSAELGRLMIKKKWQVRTIMSRSAQQFITPLTFQSLTSGPVYTSIFDSDYYAGHISLSSWADFAVVAPATANTIAKVAAGMADNLLTSFILDFSGPVFLCPAMHSGMWKAAPTCDNIEKLKKRGFIIIGPEKGPLACGDSGPGRMSEPQDILETITENLKNSSTK